MNHQLSSTFLPKALLGLILVVALAIMVGVAVQESAIMDELAHIPAGYSYVKFFDYRLNPEHPPLVKIISALPLTFMDLKFPLDQPAWRDDVNGQWAVGSQFLYEEGNDAEKIIHWARIGPMLLTLLLVFFVYYWSRELIGASWALLPTLMTAFSPTVLSHGHYVTTDIGAALGIIVSLYYFTKFLGQPTRGNLVKAGLAFGLAQLLKFSAVILIPFFIVLLFIFYLTELAKSWPSQPPKWNRWLRHGCRYFGSLFLIFFIGYLLLYPFYFMTTLNYPPDRQIRDTDFILHSFAGGPTPAGERCQLMRCLANLDIWASDKPLLRPLAQYLLGVLMVLQRSAGGNTTYFLGEVSASGSHLYFPVVYLLKEPVPILILIFAALGFALYRLGRAIKEKRLRFADYLQTHLAEFTIMLFIVFYGGSSIMSTLNIGLRHLLPIIPLFYILASVSLKQLAWSNWLNRRLIVSLMGLLTLWFLVDVAKAYPYYLSYFNEFIGTANGWRYVTDSNYDWGQDLKRLQLFAEREKIDKIAVDYFGGGSPRYYLGDRAVLWQSRQGNPAESGIHWLAISVNTLQGARGRLHPGEPRNPEDEYQWLTDPFQPYSRAGTSIFIYKL